MFDPPTYNVNENAGSVEVCVEMEKNCIGAFDLPLNTADGRAVGEYYCTCVLELLCTVCVSG